MASQLVLASAVKVGDLVASPDWTNVRAGRKVLAITMRTLTDGSSVVTFQYGPGVSAEYAATRTVELV